MSKISNYIVKWSNLSGSVKIKILQAGATLLLLKTGLTILPFSGFRRLFHWISKSQTHQETTAKDIEETVWAVNTAANVLPVELLCLPRALATKFLLRRVPALSLEIGIEINPAKVFEAHAWIEKEGEIIIGDWSDSVSYQRLWVWE
ncbi:lasso peptide biosynthesis B2 protein [Dyadobacter frigoris]|uniref:Lasso peptide biosynthesis B2 protein n=1 Tax=Dyadobacter frigoris TaxID=2576211 RepID=A0A4U6D2M4_9BACT|nr:lasso peptide biosynthesis B2 protein [Dyadobacter frigoris]TKT91529.1 lasso peptide biosynthesis B2 protein [Dyadobacter frigoris]GLU51914.1 hypothetical protein Dfri01_13750 [Dyadobacter frigoris]